MSQATVYEPGQTLRLKTSEHMSLGGEHVVVLDRYIGKYPSVVGATYYKVELTKKRERCRYCGGPREIVEDKPCRPVDYDAMDHHDFHDASKLDVHEDWLEEIR